MEGGKIAAVGAALPVPPGYRTIDARGKWITPGVIDAHSHLGAWSQPETVDAHNDVNELTDPNTAQVWVEHSVWPQDPGFDTAREAGVTTLRSEEHTSELQSLMRISYAVFCLKKKKTTKPN